MRRDWTVMRWSGGRSADGDYGSDGARGRSGECVWSDGGDDLCDDARRWEEEGKEKQEGNALDREADRKHQDLHIG